MANFLPGEHVVSTFDDATGVVTAWTDGAHMRVHWDDGTDTTESMNDGSVDHDWTGYLGEDDCRD